LQKSQLGTLSLGNSRLLWRDTNKGVGCTSTLPESILEMGPDPTRAYF